MQDRRRQPRKDLMSYSQVYDLSDGRLIGYLSDHPIKENKDLSISIELPELPRIHDTSLILSVRVAYCHQDISPDYYNVGIEFNTTTQKQQSIIQAVMDNYEFRRQAPNYPLHPNEMDDL
jgi:hypothetical protein